MITKIGLALIILATSVVGGRAADKPTIAENAVSADKPASFVSAVTGAGRPMILIPGLSCGANVWDGTIAHFQGSYQIHAVTLAGFAGQPAVSGPFLEKVRDGLAGYIREQKLERPIIVGHSLGAFLAFWLAAENPELVGPIVAVDGVPYFPALRDPKTTPASQKALAGMLRNGLKTQTSAQYAFSNRFTLAGMITAPKDIEMVASLSDKSSPAAVGQAIYELMTIDLREKLPAIASPVLLLGAVPEGSTQEEESYRAQVSAAPRYKVIFARHSRHFIQLDEPSFLYETMEAFLKDATAEPNK